MNEISPDFVGDNPKTMKEGTITPENKTLSEGETIKEKFELTEFDIIKTNLRTFIQPKYKIKRPLISGDDLILLNRIINTLLAIKGK